MSVKKGTPDRMALEKSWECHRDRDRNRNRNLSGLGVLLLFFSRPSVFSPSCCVPSLAFVLGFRLLFLLRLLIPRTTHPTRRRGTTACAFNASERCHCCYCCVAVQCALRPSWSCAGVVVDQLRLPASYRVGSRWTVPSPQPMRDMRMGTGTGTEMGRWAEARKERNGHIGKSGQGRRSRGTAHGRQDRTRIGMWKRMWICMLDECGCGCGCGC